MRYVRHSPEPNDLNVYRESGGDWDHAPKAAIKSLLLKDQQGLCGFCCCRLPAVGEFQRIAHIIPRSADKSLALAYDNMVLSCSSGKPDTPDSKPRSNVVTCDESQGHRDLPVKPTDPDCQNAFSYTADGAILGVSPDASKSVQVLNLDCLRLRGARRALYDVADELYESCSARDEWVEWSRFLGTSTASPIGFLPYIQYMFP